MLWRRLWLAYGSFALLGGAAACGGGGNDAGNDAGAGGPDSAGGDSGVDSGPPVGASVLEMHNHINRDGLYVDPALTATAAKTMHLDATFDGTVTGHVYASPLYVESGPGGKGAFYVATESNDVYALDETSGKPVWHENVGPPAQQSGAGCGNVNPLGITGTPAIDLATRLIVFDAATADANGDIATHTIHALSIDDGSETWKLDVSTVKDQLQRSFVPKPENQRSAVLIVGGIAYVTFGGHSGDCADYHGWIVGVPLAGPAATKAYATPIKAAGMWGPGGPASDGSAVFMVTGNREDYSPVGDTWAGSECVFRFTAGPAWSGQSADYWVPANWDSVVGTQAALDQGDIDLGGAGPLVVEAPALNPSALVVAVGKDGYAYALDRANLGGLKVPALGALHISDGELINSPAWATVGGTTFIVAHSHKGGNGVGCPNGGAGDLVAFAFDPTAANKMKVVWCASSQGQGSPTITTSDGTNDALVWTVGAQPGDNLLHAWNLATGAVVFAGGADQAPNVRQLTTAIDVKGRILTAGDGKLYAFKP
jgi:hypothetical protein